MIKRTGRAKVLKPYFRASIISLHSLIWGKRLRGAPGSTSMALKASRYRLQNEQLWQAFNRFAQRSYIIDWRARVDSLPFEENPSFGSLLYALSVVETDTQSVYQRLCQANAYRRPPMYAFVTAWLQEELEHGRALEAMAEKYRANKCVMGRRQRSSLRSTLSGPALYAARLVSPGIESVYATVGTITEYVALRIYNRCSLLATHPAASSLLREIALQESRHMMFYRNAAIIFNQNPYAQGLARIGVPLFWRPPGVDPLGLSTWRETFAPLLTDPELIAQMLRADQIVQELPGMSSIEVMRPFLKKMGIANPASKLVAGARARGHATRLSA